MLTTLEDLLNEMSPERRKRVEARTEILLAEEETLRDLRRALEQTKAAVVSGPGVDAEDTARLEHQDDFLLATLNERVCAMGGNLSLIVEFDGRPPILLTNVNRVDVEERDAEWCGFTVQSLPLAADEPQSSVEAAD